MSGIVFRRAQCLSTLGEETPQSMVRCRVTAFQRVGRHGFRQGIFRHTQFKLGATSVNGRDAAGLAEIPAMASGNRGGREVGGLDG